jgi:hypothetical protein
MPSNPSIDQKVTALNAGWYNKVAGALGQSAATFVLAQGGLGLQTADSSGLFLMADAVPPSASVAMFEAGGVSKLSSAYGLLLQALRPETNPLALQNELGDMYAGWITYRKKYYADPSGTLSQKELFSSWADHNLDPGQRARALAAYQQAAAAPLNQAFDALNSATARQKFVRSDGTSYALPAYTGTVDAAQRAISGGKSVTIHFDSSTMDTNLTHVTAQGSATGSYDIFKAGVSGSFEQLNQKAASSSLTIECTIGKFATMTTEPTGWYTSAEVTRAFSGKNDASIWDTGASAGDYTSFFGQPNGSMARRISSLVLVSDYTLTVTSKASYSQSDFQQIKASASFGVWPFASVSASGSMKKESKLNEDGSMSFTQTLPKGLIHIWGVNVLDAPK